MGSNHTGYISKARLPYLIDYTFDDYRYKRKFHFDFLDYVNDWSKIKNSYRLKIYFEVSGAYIKIPLCLLFGDIKDWVLFKYLAIIESKLPDVSFTYFSKGERYGYNYSKVIQYNETIIKTFHVLNENKPVPLLNYIKHLERGYSTSMVNSIVKQYIDILEFESSEYFENYSQHDYSDSGSNNFNDTFYNDSLDLDQQDPEFWDSL